MNKRTVATILIFALLAVLFMFSALALHERTHTCDDIFCDVCNYTSEIRKTVEIISVILIGACVTLSLLAHDYLLRITESPTGLDSATPVGRRVELLD